MTEVAFAAPRSVRARRWGVGDVAAVALTALVLGVFVALPLVSVAAEALRAGIVPALATFADPYARSAIALTATVVVATVAVNGAFGLFAAWTLAKYDFPAKPLIVGIIDLPLTISPVVAGLAVLLCFANGSPVGIWLAAHGVKVAFAPIGIVLATIFVTFSYVTRETLALMTELGRADEEAALGLGASVWQTFARVTFPRVRWAFVNGLLLCNARALGEFGAVSVVSGRIRGLTDTVPLHVEILYNEDNFVGAFTLAGALAIIAIALTLLRSALARRTPAAPTAELAEFAD